MDLSAYTGEPPGGHPFLRPKGRRRLHLLLQPLPSRPCARRSESLADPRTWEAFTCLEPGTRFDQEKLDAGRTVACVMAGRSRPSSSRSSSRGS